MVQSIVMATINNVPEELHAQADDFECVMKDCKLYMEKYGVTFSNLIGDLRTVLNE